MTRVPENAASNNPEENHFLNLWSLGYRRQLPIIPPNAPISENSILSRNPKAPGKAVGIKGSDGRWFGMKDWLNHETTELDIARWRRMGAGVGVKAGPIDSGKPDGEHLVFIDSDTYDTPLAKQVDDIVRKHFGPLPCRVGLYPKALYPIRVAGPVPRDAVRFGNVDQETGKRKHCVELLVNGQQAVFHGVHPIAKTPYRWARELVSYDGLPLVQAEQMRAFMDVLQRELPDAARSRADGPTAEQREIIDQDRLKGDMDLGEAAMRALPNTPEHFPDYKDMVTMGYACKGLFADDPDRGFEAWNEWFSRWPGEGYDFQQARVYWEGFKEPRRVGAHYIFRKAAELAPDKFNIGEVYFQPIDEASERRNAELGGLFDESATKGDDPDSGKRTFKLITAAESAAIATRAKARPLVEKLLDCGALSVIYGAPGVGKSFVMLDMAYRIAAGIAHGARRVTQGPVVYVAAEGGGAIHARVKALVDKHGAYLAESFPVPFYILPERVDLRDPKADLTPFLDSLRDAERGAGKIVLVVIDTLARSMGGGDENSPVDMGAMVAHFDKIRAFTGAHVAVVHHTGKDAARGMRGHSSLLGAIDTELEVSEGVVKSEKQRDMESGERFGYRLISVEVGKTPEGDPVETAIVDIVAPGKQAGPIDPASLPRRERNIVEAFKAAGAGAVLGVKEIASALTLSTGKAPDHGSIRKGLSELLKKGVVEKVDRERWTLRADRLSETDEADETP